MRKYLIKAICAAVCAVMLTTPVLAVTVSANAPTGADAVATEMILVDGRSTGVALTQYSLAEGTAYARGAAGLVNVIELDPSNEKVSVKVLNCGNYTWSRKTVGTAAVEYNRSGQGTVIAAMNTDPWIVYHTDYDGDGVAATGPGVKHVTVSRGMTIIDGEIWASAQISDENNLARNDNAERGTSAANQPLFGVRSDGTAVIGTPIIELRIKNVTNSQELAADGINRLPAPDSTIIYNGRCGTESFAFSDAYEIYLECESAAFGIGGTVSGVVTHIFDSGYDGERPAIGKNTLIISARGDAIGAQRGRYSVGDSVSIDCAVTGDALGLSAAEDWYSVVEATGGFYTLIENGIHKGQELSTSYPCTIAGIKRDGTIVMISTTSQKDGSRSACRMQDMQELVEELGCYTAVMFDGGGSTQMITLEGDGYVRRSSVSDGENSVRSVISGLALVYNEADTEPSNYEAHGFKLLDGLGKESTFDGAGAYIEGAASYAYYYVAEVTAINGKGYSGLRGMRDPAYNVAWSTEQKRASIQPAVLDGSGIKFDSELILRVSGYAFANGAQKRLLYSVDGVNWYEAVGGSYSSASAELTQTVMNNGWIKTATAERAVFDGVGADLRRYEGQTVSVYFALTPGADDKALHFLTVEGVSVALSEAEAPPTENVPEQSEPEQSKPEQNQPEQNQPEQNQPEQNQPEQNQPNTDNGGNSDQGDGPATGDDTPSKAPSKVLYAVIGIIAVACAAIGAVLAVVKRKYRK